MVRQILVLLILLSSTYFFRFAYLPKNLLLLISLGSTAFIAITVALSYIYDKGKKFKHNFTTEVFLILLSTLFGIFGAKWGHNQNFLLTVWVQSNMYFYFFYFFLHVIRIRPGELEKALIYISYLYIVFFIFQYIVYPKEIFNVRLQEARGTIRIFLPGRAFAALMYFYFLQKFFKNNNLIHLGYCLAFITTAILQGTRSFIVFLLLGTLINLLLSKRVKSKLLITILLFICIIPVFIIFQDIFINLIELSETQSGVEGEDIRIRSAKFFLTDFYPSKLNYLIGNGKSHMMSSYGLKVWFYQINYGFYQSDLGLIGEFTKYGLLYIIGVVLIVWKIFVTKLDYKYNYVKYFMLISLQSMIFGSFFTSPTSIVATMSILYIIDVSEYNKSHAKGDIKNHNKKLKQHK